MVLELQRQNGVPKECRAVYLKSSTNVDFHYISETDFPDTCKNGNYAKSLKVSQE